MQNSQIYKTISFNERITVIEEEGVRMFVLKGSKGALLVDTGYGGGDIKHIAHSIAKQDFKVIITHPDMDHIGGVGPFGQVYMHPSDFAQFRCKCSKKDIKVMPVYENDIFDLGDMKWEIIEIPGHTCGSIALLDRENRILISGDSVQEGPIYMFGEYRSLEAQILSLKKLDKMKDAFDVILPCHNMLPVKTDILPILIEGAEKLWRGELLGKPVDLGWTQTTRYDYKFVSFYY
ncbi:MAG: MBL fold metallo-hydrolase [Eubacteriaceae bacterium]|nr:MBL fold metallo-hydrolase [Eubacteriaceae bacterium]